MESLKNKIMQVLLDRVVKHKNLTHLSEILSKILREDSGKILSALKELEEEGKIYSFAKNKYVTSASLNMRVGVLSKKSNGYAFVLQEDEDIFVTDKNLMGAIDGDTVLCKVTVPKRMGRRREGRIVKIIERDNEGLIGSIFLDSKTRYIVPDKKRITVEVIGDTMGARTGDKVVFDIIGYKGGVATGVVKEVIGDITKVGNDIKWMLKSYKIDREFSPEAIKQAKNIEQVVDKSKYEGRRDLRDEKIFTIDGKEAKDLDDAVSVKKYSDGTYSLGVHIADVGEYVHMSTPLDKDAYSRATSIYFLNQVIPMLPVELSNGICSLNEGVDRLCLSVVMHIDNNGEVLDSEIFESVIKSKHRLNYDEVQLLLEKDLPTISRLSDIKDELYIMHELSRKLIERRKRLGSIDFNIPEGEVVVDENNRPISIEKRYSTDSTRLIENFMVVANEVVAKTFENKKIPFVYRVHEKPDSEKMHAFFNFADLLGVKVNGEGEDIAPKYLQNILDKVKDSDVGAVINMVMLRSLKKARYLDECLGHFGMSLRYYCHFTSPIRRYPDLCIHRIIKEYLHGNNGYIKSHEMKEFVSKASLQSSIKEKTSEEVERVINDYKKVEYMEKFVGQTFKGIISSVTSRGFYVELDNTCEGMVSLSSIKDDFYFFDDNSLCLYSHSGKTYRIGDKVEVVLVATSRENRRIDFELKSKIK